MNNCIRVTVNTQKTCFCPWYRTRWQMVEIINNNKSRTLCIRYLNIHAPFYTFHTFQITLRMRVKAEDSRSEMQVPREVVPFQNSTTRTQQHQRHPQQCCAKYSSGVRWPEILQRRHSGKQPEGAEMLDVEERVLVQGYWQDKTEMWDKLEGDGKDDGMNIFILAL